MAKEKEKHEGAKKHEGGKKKMKLRGIHTHIADDGSFIHEHHYEDHKGHPLPPRYGGVSEDMADLHQHMDDHAAPASAELGGGGGEPQGGAGEGEGEGEGQGEPQAQPAPQGGEEDDE